MKQVNQAFFRRDALDVAQALLGCVVSFNGCSGMIVETEAYKADASSHAATKTARSAIMYDTSGHWYVYFIYGMYHCVNVTTNGVTEPGAVLIRALKPLNGLKAMEKMRKSSDIHNLCSGPGKLCQALGIDKKLNGSPVNSRMKVFQGKRFKDKDIEVSKRIGIKEDIPLDWRFSLKDNAFVSR